MIKFFAMCFVVSGCIFSKGPSGVHLDNAPTITPALDEEFNLVSNQSAQVDTLNFQFIKVTEDSRCPPKTTCVWQGQLVALFKAKTPAKEEEFTLTYEEGKPSLGEKIFEGYKIKLNDANSTATSDKEKPKYSLKFVLSKK